MPRKKGVGASVTYTKADGSQGQYDSIYNNVFMNKMKTSSIDSRIRTSTSFRNIIVAQMITQLHTLLILDEINMLEEDFTKFFVQFPRSEIMRPLNESRREDWCSYYNELELGLLNTAAEFEIDTNHCALSAHVDKNKDGNLESLLLFGRVVLSDCTETNNKKIDQTLATKIVNDMKGGYIFFPVEGIVLYISCGDMILNCNLKKTIHLPDYDRGMINFSQVSHSTRGGGNLNGDRLRRVHERNLTRNAAVNEAAGVAAMERQHQHAAAQVILGQEQILNDIQR